MFGEHLAVIAGAPRLDLDDREHAAAPGVEVELADARVETPRQHGLAAQPQRPDAERLGEVAEAVGAAARRLAHRWRVSSRARAYTARRGAPVAAATPAAASRTD